MANLYTSQTISGYNDNPPPDDGSKTADNEITWAKHKEKLGDPLRTLAEAINTELVNKLQVGTAANELPRRDANGNLPMADTALLRPSAVQATDISGGSTITANWQNGERVKATADQNFTLALSNFPTGKASAVVVEAVNWGNFTVTHPAALQFEASTAPTYTVSGTDILVIEQDDDGVATLFMAAQGVGTV